MAGRRRRQYLTSVGAALIGALVSSAMSANAGIIYSEDFNNIAGFQGNPSYLNSFSDKYLQTSYYLINNFDGWTFSGGAYYALSGGDGAVLLNENGPTSASTAVPGLVPGDTYALLFDYWGDNEPGLAWVLTLAIDGMSVLDISAVDFAPGTNPGTLETIYFTATSTSAVLDFGQASPPFPGASPIIDNVMVEGESAAIIPEPSTWAMMLLGFAGLAY